MVFMYVPAADGPAISGAAAAGIRRAKDQKDLYVRKERGYANEAASIQTKNMAQLIQDPFCVDMQTEELPPCWPIDVQPGVWNRS